MDVNVSQVDGQVTVSGRGWQLDVFEVSRTWRKPDGATDVHVILGGAAPGTPEGDGPRAAKTYSLEVAR